METNEFFSPLTMHLLRGAVFLGIVFGIASLVGRSGGNTIGSLNRFWKAVVVLLGGVAILQWIPSAFDISIRTENPSIATPGETSAHGELPDQVGANPTLPEAGTLSLTEVEPIEKGQGTLIASSELTTDSQAETGYAWLGWLFFVVWFAGAMVVMMRWVIARIQLARLQRNAMEVEDEDLVRACHHYRKELGIQAPVTLLESREIAIPMTWGLFKPTVLIPMCAQGWTRDERHMALFHELGHVKAGDSRYQLMTRIVTALHWMNPLVWMAGHRLSVQQEEIADKRVLEAGASPTETVRPNNRPS